MIVPLAQILASVMQPDGIYGLEKTIIAQFEILTLASLHLHEGLVKGAASCGTSCMLYANLLVHKILLSAYLNKREADSNQKVGDPIHKSGK